MWRPLLALASTCALAACEPHRSTHAATVGIDAVPPALERAAGATTSNLAAPTVPRATAAARLARARGPSPDGPAGDLGAEALANLRVGRMLLESGDARGALFEAALATRRDPGLAPGWWLRGRASLELGEVEGARDDLESAVILDPRSARTLNDYACALLLDEQPRRAAQVLEAAAQIEPQAAFIRFNLGFAYERLGRAADAHAAFVRATELGELPEEDSRFPLPAPLRFAGAAPARADLGARPDAGDAATAEPDAREQAAWKHVDDDPSGADFQDEAAGDVADCQNDAVDEPTAGRTPDPDADAPRAAGP